MKFHYIASQSDEKVIEGEMEARGVAEVLEFLASKGMKPLSLKREEGYEVSDKKWLSIFRSRITMADKIFLTKYLALMLKIGTDIFKAIDILISDFDKPAVRAFLYEIRENLENGLPFHTAFENHQEEFSSVFVNLIKAGETSGGLERTFEGLSDKMQKDRELVQQIRSAVVYPMLLVVVSVLVVVFLVSFALPRISKIFTDSSIDPPTFSKIVFGIGGFLNSYIFLILAFFVVFGVTVYFLFTKSPAFKSEIQGILRRLPLVGNLLREISLQRFATTLSALLNSGLPIITALDITADTVGDEGVKEALMRISRDGISKGLTLGEAFKKESIFPKMIINLVSISEKGGNLANVLMTLSDFYESEIKSSIKILVSFLEPLLLLFIGSIVAVIALSIIVPVYQLIGKF